jgi:hypothetical protein
VVVQALKQVQVTSLRPAAPSPSFFWELMRNNPPLFQSPNSTVANQGSKNSTISRAAQQRLLTCDMLLLHLSTIFSRVKTDE